MVESKNSPTDNEIAEPITANLVVLPTEDTPQYYVNHVEVASSRNEFAMFCTRVPSKIQPDQIDQIEKNGNLRLEPELEITFPVTIIQGLIDALTKQRDAYSKLFGTPWNRGEGGES